jgi:acetyltransferase-like isoleucine patch superfamily enzyme
MISEKSTVQTDNIGINSIIQEYCVIRPGVKIGNNVIIHPHVTIYEGVEIQDGVEIFPGVFIGKEPKGTNSLLRELDFNKKVIIGENTSIGPNSIVYYDVEIGRNCLIGDAAAIREKCRIGAGCIIGRHASLLYNVTIGEGSKVMSNAHLTGHTEIGRNVIISVGVNTVNDNNFGQLGYDRDEIFGPIIEDNAKIGAGATILPKIRIGENAIVAAGSVVTKNVVKNSVVMGVPAIHVKFVGEGETI